jgi:hypothetical protein
LRELIGRQQGDGLFKVFHGHPAIIACAGRAVMAGRMAVEVDEK